MSAPEQAAGVSVRWADLVAAITVRGGRGVDRGILAVWRTGRLVWSADPVNGGPPYYEATIDAERAARLPAQLEALGIEPATARSHGPDAKWTHIQVFDGPRAILDLGSWHEVHESRPGVVVTSTGVEPLGGRTRSDVVARQPAEYRAFRGQWDEVKRALVALVPPAGVGRLAREHPWS